MKISFKRFKLTLTSLSGIFLLFILGCDLSGGETPEDQTSGDQTSIYDDGRVNFFGIHTMVFSGDDLDKHLDWAESLVGPGGYVKQTFSPVVNSTTAPQKMWRDYIKKAYERDLVPVIRLSGEFTGSYWIKPQTDDGGAPTGPGSYSQIAQAYKEVVQDLPLKAGLPLYIEVGNEPNLSFEWSGETPDPRAFGYFLTAVYDALKSIGDDRIQVLNGALSPGRSASGKTGAADFVRTMFQQAPGSINSFDAWASHCYPGWYAPNYNNHDGTAVDRDMAIDSYIVETEILEEFGRSGVDVFITETAYSLGHPDINGHDRVTDDNQAEWTASAFSDYWGSWDEVKAVTPYILLNEHNSDWVAFEWLESGSDVDSSGYPTKPRPVYTDVAGLEKPPAADFPAFNGTENTNWDLSSSSVLFGSAVTASSSIELYGWSLDQVTDTVTEGQGWHSEGRARVVGEPLVIDDFQEWLEFDLGTSGSFGELYLYPRSDNDTEAGRYFPQAFTVSVSEDGSSWTEVFSWDYDDTNASILTPLGGQSYLLDAPASGRFVKILFTELTYNVEGNNYHVALAEVEAY
ncbi:MAG: discoidin domain-containing protein [Spirochaetales bacterium]|nr:discoidin domain-containing protein [Spirochaetales bacterium]